MIVLDSSAVVEWLLRTDAGLRIEERIFSTAVTLHAPHVLDVEVLHVLRRYVARRLITASSARERLERWLDIALHRHAHETERIWELRDNLTAYDAAYVALAESLDAPLLTCDAKLAAAPGHFARVELV